MANWLIWQNDFGELAYGELENGEMTSNPSVQLLKPL